MDVDVMPDAKWAHHIGFDNLVMKTFAQLFFENNAFIMNSVILKLKIWINQLSRLLRNSIIHIEFHSKLFIGMS
jgi:hypothetical protein